MKNRKKKFLLFFLQLCPVENWYPVIYWQVLLGKKIISCGQINLRNTGIKSCLYCWASRNPSYASVHGGERFGTTLPKWNICYSLQGPKCTGKASPGNASHLPRPTQSSAQIHFQITFSRFSKLSDSIAVNFMTSAARCPRLQTRNCCSASRWQTRQKQTKLLKSDWTVWTVTCTGSSPTQVFVYLKKCLLWGLEKRVDYLHPEHYRWNT